MRKIILITLVLIAGFSSKAQYAGYSTVADLTKFRTEFAAATQKTNSIKSDFTQEKNLSMLSEKIILKENSGLKKKTRYVWNTTSLINT